MDKDYSSNITGFHKKTIEERRNILKSLVLLSEEKIASLSKVNLLSEDELNSMIENVVGSYSLPLGIATNFQINQKDYLIPMVTEEASVIAAASKAAKPAWPYVSIR